MATSDIDGLIIVGNSGVGKSFLANIILDKHYFKHDFSARSVTQRTESVTCLLRQKQFRIYNIPGLIEGDEERINLNKREISRAFDEQKENAVIIIYVFGHQNGRIRNEDIVSFRALHNAYKFNTDSLITVINGLPPDRPITYDEDTQATLINLLGMKPGQICFINHLNTNDIHREPVRQYLIDTLLNVHPRQHTKINDIDLMVDDVYQLQNEIDMLHINMDNQRYEHEDIMNNMERNYEATGRVLALQRLFFQAKANLHRLVVFQEEEEHLTSIIEQWEAQEIAYEDDPTSDYYTQAVQHKQDAQIQLMTNLETKHNTCIALNVCRKDIEQICFELEQIYHGKFDREHEHTREYYNLLDELCSDLTIHHVKHNFLNDLYTFTYLRYSNTE